MKRFNTPNREFKGKNLLLFPKNYTVIDLETTGFDPTFDSILELSAIRIRNCSIAESYHTLVNDRDPYIDKFITELTGITKEMISDAPNINEVFPRFLEFIGNDIVVGHNVNFDINFIYDHNMINSGIPFSNDFADTLRFGRRLYPDMPHHRLSDMAEMYEISTDGSHRAFRDCEITYAVFEKLREKTISDFGSENGLSEFVRKKENSRHLDARNIHGDIEKNDPDNLLYGKVCVFTGALEKMIRADAMQMAADIGAIVANGITKKTNYLILGNLDYCKSLKGGKSSKQKKAEELIAKGADLQIIPENVFYELIDL